MGDMDSTPVSRFHTHVPPVTGGSYPVRSGNLVRPLVDGMPAFRRIGEAVDAARHSIWLTVAFYAPDFSFPDDRGGLFDVLDRAVERGLDVRAIFWRPNPESSGYGRTFPGSQADRDLLEARGSRFLIRWDRAPAVFCQHQKSWLIDAGQPTETAFIGGINLTAMALGSPGHRDGGRHDLYVEVSGPSAADVHHNFVQRWNEASERASEDGRWPPESTVASAALAFPTRASTSRGPSVVQIQRMMPPARYTDRSAAPVSGKQFDIVAGERSILEQYHHAIDAARQAIYIENQALPVPRIAARLEEALKRGVEVVVLVPAEPEARARSARRDPARRELFERIEALGRYETFLLAGIAAAEGQSRRRSIYVHAKAMLVDDEWATVGSCNLHSNSLSGHAELNASVWDRDVVRKLRCELLREHLGEDTNHLNSQAALRRYGQIARANGARARDGDHDWQGLAFALDPRTYGS